ncbi:MAG TPA: membrane protein insertase YidC [Candidatus Coproplasma avicola]|uniref:Membrane protein insertase YidC n=1 Tax=Candidatus Coproplasma avicola TaxID=2840744 RepID=A0A9D1E4Y8_9FIRM|nr:membrane protein insertase YidC [Candidatus Coproplasma avicola]
MELLAISQGVLGYGVKLIPEISLNWIGIVIQWLIEGIGITGVGIIVFTLILKTIVLPLDIYSRIKTKKQSLVMDKMRPQMEKLQKQYANDKGLYQQKVMELQKKNGYSMFGACLPMIVSLIIFLIVLNAFSTYSQYATLQSYNDMVNSYNGVVEAYVYDEQSNPDGFLHETTLSDGSVDYYVDFSAFANEYVRTNNGGEAMTEEQVYSALMQEYREETGTVIADGIENSADEDTREEVRLTLVSYYIDGYAAQKVADDYQPNNFLWVKNIWYPDSMLNREIPDFAGFRSTVASANVDDSYEESYNKVTANLTQQKQNYNGYFILIVISIGVMLLQQFISMRSNKAANELGTVDGSAQRTTKWMMILMPIMYGFFAFMYSSAFSIYMITNTTYSIIMSLIINKAMTVWFEKKEEQAEHIRMRKGK